MRFVLSLCFWFFVTGAIAQEAYVVVDSIAINGNKRTNIQVILRELPFQIGDTILRKNLKDRLAWGKQQVLNTGMFREGIISHTPSATKPDHICIALDLAESWYIYPTPYFELADRNFNVWWVDQNRSLDRIIYGMDFVHRNFSGNRDRFHAGDSSFTNCVQRAAMSSEAPPSITTFTGALWKSSFTTGSNASEARISGMTMKKLKMPM